MFTVTPHPDNPKDVFTIEDITIKFNHDGSTFLSLPSLPESVLYKLKEDTMSLDFSGRSSHSQLGITFYIPPAILKEWYIGNQTNGEWKTPYENYTYSWQKTDKGIIISLPENLSTLTKSKNYINNQ